MASNREERFLMRQRGAGTRQLRGSDFALDIPDGAGTPVQPQSTGRAQTTPQLQSQRTPKSTPRTYSKKITPRSVRVRKSASAGKSVSPIAEAATEDGGGSARKKRRLAAPIEAIVEEEPEVQTPEETPENTSIDDIIPEEAPDNDVVTEEGIQEDNTIVEEGADQLEEGQAETSSPATPSKRRKKRKSIAQRPKKRKSTSLANMFTPSHEDTAQTIDIATDAPESPDLQEAHEGEAMISPIMKRKRKSSGQEPVVDGNTTTETAGSSAAQAGQTPLKKRGRPPGKRIEELRNDAVTTPGSEKRRGRPRKSELPTPSKESPVITSTGKPRGRPRKSEVVAPARSTNYDANHGAQETSVSNAKAIRPRSTLTTAEANSATSTAKSHGKRKRQTSPRNEIEEMDGTEEAEVEEEQVERSEAEETPQQSRPTPRNAKLRPAPIAKAHGRPRRSDVPAADSSEAEEAAPRPTKLRKKARHSDVSATAPARSDRHGDLTTAKPRGRPRKSDVSTGPRQNLVSDSTAKPRGRPRKSEVSTAEATPRTRPSQKAPSARRRSSPVEDDAPSQVQSKTKAGSIPVLVHRLLRPQALNFVQGEDDDLAGPAPLLKKAGVNAIDVLSQICREILAKSMESLRMSAQAEQGNKRAEWKRKRGVVEMFDQDLQARLLQMTTALDHNSGLAMKLRQVNRSKTGYRDELLALRNEREDLALQMDTVRIKHDEKTESVRGVNDINTALHDIELAIQTGRAAQQATNDADDSNHLDLEARLRKVADTVSSAGGRQGLLEKVKRYNAYLEAAVGAL